MTAGARTLSGTEAGGTGFFEVMQGAGCTESAS